MERALDETLDEPALGTADRHRFGERFVADLLVGSGGMGMVLRGRDLLDGSRVALKILYRKEWLAVERFAREAEMLAGLLHPAIVRYVAHGRSVQGEPYLVMEWLDGESLADRLEREVLEPSAVARLGARVLRALAVAHGQDIVHRDIKPSNLFLVNGDLEQAKLLDFGIAQKADSEWQVTRPGGVTGTPLYMAPEQGGACGSQQLDSRADIFSLACVLYECISGEAPRWRMVQGRPAWDEEALFELRQQCPEPLRNLFDGMTALAPESRSAQADKLADELTVVAELLAEHLVEGRVVPVSRSRQTLSAEERRSTVVLFGNSRTEGNEFGCDALREALAAAGAKLVQSAGGWTATFPTSAIPADQATRAARVALRLRKKLPSVGLTIGMNAELPP